MLQIAVNASAGSSLRNVFPFSILSTTYKYNSVIFIVFYYYSLFLHLNVIFDT